MPIKVKRKILRKSVSSLVAVPKPGDLVQPNLPIMELESRKDNPSKSKSKSPIDTSGAETNKTAKQLANAVDNLLLRGRAYRLSIGNSLGAQRALTEEERQKVLRQQASSVKTSKQLYDPKDPHLRRLFQAQREVRLFFNSHTIAHPEEATRLFVIKESKVAWANMSAEEAEIEMARQLDVFHALMQQRIETYYDTEVKAVVDNWAEILARAEAFTSDLFDRTQYPRESELRDMLYIRFYPVPSALPPEYNRIDPAMRNRVAAYMREQIEISLAQHITTIEDSLTQSLQSLKERVESAGSEGVGQRFFASRVTNVTEAIEDYERTMASLGLSLGKSLPDRLKALRAVIDRAGDDPHKVISQIKNSSTSRADLLSSLNEAITATASAFAPVRRRITID